MESSGLPFGSGLSPSRKSPHSSNVDGHSRATNQVLHLPDAAVGHRAAALARFDERFGWIHAFDALQDVRGESRA